MVVIHERNTRNFNNLGLCVLDDIVTKCEVVEELNKTNYLELQVVIDNNKKYEFLDYERILVVDTPNGTQPFRIKDIIKTQYTIEVFARHLCFDIENDIIEDTNIVGKNGASALQQIKLNLKNEGKNFNFYSDINNTANSRLVRKYGMTSILSDDENSFLNRWGGEAEFDNNNFYMRNHRGSDRGFEVLYKKNITGFNAKITTDHIGTRILVQGYDGLFLSDNLNERFINSPLINSYDRIYSKHLKFDDVKVKEYPEDEGFNTIAEARAELRRRVQLEFDKGLDKPKFIADVNFVLLQDTVEYGDVAILERIYLGDTVSIKLEHLNINIKQRIVSYKYNCLTKKYIQVSLGEEIDNFYQTIKDEIDSGFNNKFEGINTEWESKFEQSVSEATDKINAGLGGYVTKLPAELLIMDTADINTAQKLWRWNINGLGFSSTGYRGEYQTALTSDGKFVINEITSNKISANLLEAGSITSIDGSTTINLDNGTFNLANRLTFDGTDLKIQSSTAEDYISINGGAINFRESRKKELLGGSVQTYLKAWRDYNGVAQVIGGYGDYWEVSKAEGNTDITSDKAVNATPLLRVVPQVPPNWDGANGSHPLPRDGIICYKQLSVLDKAGIRFPTNTEDNFIRPNQTNDAILEVAGKDKVDIGIRWGSEFKSGITVAEADTSLNRVYMHSWGSWDFHNFSIYNCANIRSALSSTATKTYTECNAMFTEEKEIRYLYKNVKSTNNQIILSIPNRFKGNMIGYDIVGIVKKGKGDIWVKEELVDRFLLETDTDLTVNIEISIKLLEE